MGARRPARGPRANPAKRIAWGEEEQGSGRRFGRCSARNRAKRTLLRRGRRGPVPGQGRLLQPEVNRPHRARRHPTAGLLRSRRDAPLGDSSPAGLSCHSEARLRRRIFTSRSFAALRMTNRAALCGRPYSVFPRGGGCLRRAYFFYTKKIGERTCLRAAALRYPAEGP